MIRISTLLRVAEDATISVASNVARRTKNAVHATSIEYQARMLARAQAAIVKEQRLYRGVSSDERAAAAKDIAAIQARAADLIAERKEPRYKHMRSDAVPSAQRDAKRKPTKNEEILANMKRSPRAKRSAK